MFRLYRSTEVHRHETSVSGVIDGIDASRIQKAVIALPEKHRLAMGWCYIKRSSPAKAAASLGHSLHGLAELIHDGRQMLLNRGT